MNLVENESATIPNLKLNRNRSISSGFGHDNETLQMAEWAYHKLFAGAVFDDFTGKAMEYRNLIKSESQLTESLKPPSRLTRPSHSSQQKHQ